MIALTASTAHTPLETIADPVVLIDDGTIVEVGPRAAVSIPNSARVVNFGDYVLAPGFVDIHMHGGAGHDIMEAASEALPAIERLLGQHGVTAYLPTTVAAPIDFTLAALERLANAIEGNHREAGRARPLGIHLEGPFLSHARRGVHRAEDLQKPTVSLFNRFWEASRGHVRLVTMAPELDGATEVIAEAVKRGVTISLGHTDAAINTAAVAIAAGARHVTHTFNAMRPISHRNPGVLEIALTDDRLSADIIADGIHVDPVLLKLFFRAKGAERAVLITDALAATGMPDGHYHLGELEFDLKDGRCFSGKTLAGSVLTLDRAITNFMKYTDASFVQALRAATLNPAKAAGVGGGTLAPGCRADIVVLDASFRPVRTIVSGQCE